MKRKLAFCFVVAGLAILSAKSYSMSLYGPTLVGATELKAGDYQVELDGQTAVIKHGRVHAEAAVTVATAEKKYDTTWAVISTAGGKSRLQEIHLGGTTTKLILSQ